MRILFSQNAIQVCEYEGRALSYSTLENWVKLGLGATLLPASKVLDISTAKRLEDNNGALVSIEFQACWLATQQHRRCFNLLHESLKFAAK